MFPFEKHTRKHRLEIKRTEAKMDTVFDCVVHYIHNASDRNSFSLASRTCYDVDAKTLHNWDHNLTPWVQEIATSFKRLKVVRFQNLDVHDSDLELLARTRGEKLRVLEIDTSISS
nr:hypothetical protein [Tanacetum cinerariifolium]